MFLLVIQLVVDEIVEREDRTNNTAKTGWGVTGFAASALGEIVAPGEVHGEHHVVGLDGEGLDKLLDVHVGQEVKDVLQPVDDLVVDR